MKLFGKIGRRLLGWFLVVALIPLLFMGYQGYYFARQAVQREVFLHMEAIAQAKRNAIEQWFAERQHDLQVLASNPAIEDGVARPERVRGVLEAFRKQSQEYSVISIKYPRLPDTMCVPPDGILYDTDHARSENRLPTVAFGMSGVYLDPRFGPSITLWQPIADSGMLICGEIVAELALTNSLNPIILDTTGLGSTGQAYLVDADKVMLTPSRFMNHPAPLQHKMDSEGIRKALAGSSGSGVYTGFDGQPVLGAWAYLPDHKWALIAEMNADEAFAPLAVLRREAILVALITLGAVMIVVAFVSRSISLPIRQLADASLDVSRGNLDRTVVVRLKDEVGELAERFNLMVHSMKESQRQIVQSERLAAIGELVASVVHEIRNPLSAVKMNLRILENKCATDAVVAEHFKLAREQTDRLESMLEDLLDYSKPVTLKRVCVRVQDLVRDSLSDFENDGEYRDTKVVSEFEEDLPPVNLDRQRMSQVLLNLLLNARQAGTPESEIHITAAKVRENGHSAVRLDIADHGQGISEENLKHIFEPFFTTRKQGTGLGLSNARKIVEAHGGVLLVESTLNSGTCVHVILPTGGMEHD
jgi:signal transduction histidine kinase